MNCKCGKEINPKVTSMFGAGPEVVCPECAKMQISVQASAEQIKNILEDFYECYGNRGLPSLVESLQPVFAEYRFKLLERK